MPTTPVAERAGSVLITLCGLRQARVGFAFVQLGPTDRCSGCQLLRFCQGRLQQGRVYEVVALRKKTFPCAVHENGVRVVEVEEAPISANVPARSAIEGVTITFNQQECALRTCARFTECHPVGLFNGDKCRLLSLGGKVVCPDGRHLTEALLRRGP